MGESPTGPKTKKEYVPLLIEPVKRWLEIFSVNHCKPNSAGSIAHIWLSVLNKHRVTLERFDRACYRYITYEKFFPTVSDIVAIDEQMCEEEVKQRYSAYLRQRDRDESERRAKLTPEEKAEEEKARHEFFEKFLAIVKDHKM